MKRALGRRTLSVNELAQYRDGQFWTKRTIFGKKRDSVLTSLFCCTACKLHSTDFLVGSVPKHRTETFSTILYKHWKNKLVNHFQMVKLMNSTSWRHWTQLKDLTTFTNLTAMDFFPWKQANNKTKSGNVCLQILPLGMQFWHFYSLISRCLCFKI